MARRDYSSVEVKAGLFLAFCLALFVGMLMLYGKIPRMWRERQEIRAVFSSVSALKPDAAVLYNGVDVGRVKSMRIIHLDKASVALLSPITKHDLDFLPLGEIQRKKLRLVPDYEFDANLEIVSGSGRPLEAGEETYLVGHSGDFFANLARSMDQVKDVLSTVTDVVGAEERVSFKRAAGRLTPILDAITHAGEIAAKRSDATSKKLDSFDESTTKGMDAFNKLFGAMQPDNSRFFGRLDAAKEDLAKRFAEVADEADKAEAEVKAQAKDIFKDLKEAQEQSMPHFLEMQTNLHALSERVDGLAGHLDSMYYYAGRAAERSMPELPRIAESFKAGVKNLTGPELKYIREKIGEIIGKKDKGEHEYYTVQETVASLERSARGPRESIDELQDLRAFVHNPVEAGQPVTRQDIDALALKLRALQASLDVMRDAAEASMHPPFVGDTHEGSTGPFPRKLGGRAVYPKR